MAVTYSGTLSDQDSVAGTDATPPSELRTIFRDDFSSERINSALWTATEGDLKNPTLRRGGNLYQQYRAKNVFIDKQRLHIRTNNEGNQATSTGQISTRGKFSFLYGEIEIRLRYPKSTAGTQFFPALWLQQNALAASQTGMAISVVKMDPNLTAAGEDLVVRVSTGGQVNGGPIWAVDKLVKPTSDMSYDMTAYEQSFKLVWEPDCLVWLVGHTEVYRVSDKAVIPNVSMQLVLDFAVLGNVAANPSAFPGLSNTHSARTTDLYVDYIVIRQKRGSHTRPVILPPLQPLEGAVSVDMNLNRDSQITFQDNFDDASGQLNPALWTATNGAGTTPLHGFYQVQDFSAQNVYIRNKTLILHARDGLASFDSGRVDTYGKFSFQYGEVEVRARIPRGATILHFPAVWLVNQKFAFSSPWPQTGSRMSAISVLNVRETVSDLGSSLRYLQECDIKVLAGRSTTGQDLWSVSKTFGHLEEMSFKFHVFRLVWRPDCLVWYLDGTEVFRVTDRKLIPTEHMQLTMHSAKTMTSRAPSLEEMAILNPDFRIDSVVVRQPKIRFGDEYRFG
ncbi:hypothetical protein BV898_04404 [Hypsibius exemplaris]|uniref:GH16 domain-containing protein n=1 Tax=Hypsibius exemplaris TaxID=2072580 RepID=A0A1W0X2Z1_HYPEX|nr:hypothetical protein BV898_04404 [Hypsibius exemplaris]